MDERPSGIYELESYRIPKAPPTAYYFPNFITEEEEAFLLQQVYNAPKPKWVHLSGRKLQNWEFHTWELRKTPNRHQRVSMNVLTPELVRKCGSSQSFIYIKDTTWHFYESFSTCGLPHPRGMLAESLPDWLKKYVEKISLLGLFDGKVANHVLVNEYLPGEGIMPHVDGSLYFPTVTTISLGSHTVLDFYHPVSKKQDSEQVTTPQTEEERYLLSLLVEPRSLLVLKQDMYEHYLHGIKPVSSDIFTDKVANIDSCLLDSGVTLNRGTRVSLTIRHVPKVLKTTIILGRRK